MLEHITPVVLTYNEEENVGRTLRRLSWASDIVVLDSFSSDNTVAIARNCPQVRVFQRTFDSHAQQWNFAIGHCGVETEWILALDADYVLSNEFVDELAQLQPQPDINGFSAAFRYCVWGKPLRGTLYPPVNVLFRKGKAHYVQEGHTQRVQIEGRTGTLGANILHDDRKSLSKWLQAQDRYMQLEARHIGHLDWWSLGAADKMRRLSLLAPFMIFVYCYFGKFGFLDGMHGAYYAMQRMLAESLLAIRLIETRWCDAPAKAPGVDQNH